MGRFTFDPDGDVLFSLTFSETSGDIDSLSDKKASKSKKRKRTSQQAREASGEDAEESSMEMLVSSRHIMLSSSVFKAMLDRHNFAEGVALQASGHVSIPLFDDDPYAMIVIMNIIHCQMKKVPTQLTLAQLTHVAVVADKYGLQDAVDHFVQIWVENLEDELLDDENLDNLPSILPWLCISWVFKISTIFKDVTRLAIQNSESEGLDVIWQYEPTEGYPKDLPISATVMSEIEQKRIQGIRKALALLNGEILKYQSNTTIHCRNSKAVCDCATLGGLIKSACASGLYPNLSPPYETWSYARIAEEIKVIGKLVPSYCADVALSHGYHRLSSKCHDIGKDFNHRVDQITAGIPGLNLKTLLSKS